jgi:hypothetical protein
LNPGRRGGKPATNRLSYGAAKIIGYFITKCFFLNLIFTEEVIFLQFVPDISLIREGGLLNP